MTLYPTNPRLFVKTPQRWWNFISHRIDKSSGAVWQLWQSVGVWLANSQKTQQIRCSWFNDLPQRPSPPGHRHVVEQRRCDRLPFVAKRTSKTYSTPGGFHLRLSKVWERFNSFSVFLWPAAGARTCWSWAINFFLYFFCPGNGSTVVQLFLGVCTTGISRRSRLTLHTSAAKCCLQTRNFSHI